jgi:uncharacterized protein (DUF433 family)
LDVFKGTRVPAQTLLDYLDDGFSLEEFIEMFPSVNGEDAMEFLRHRGVACQSVATSQAALSTDCGRR